MKTKIFIVAVLSIFLSACYKTNNKKTEPNRNIVFSKEEIKNVTVYKYGYFRTSHKDTSYFFSDSPDLEMGSNIDFKD